VNDFTVDVDRVAELLALGDKGYSRRCEDRSAHIDSNLVVAEYVQGDNASGGAHPDGALACEAAIANKLGKTAGAVATLGDFAAVGIKNAVVEIHVRRGGCLNHQDLVTADAKVAIPQLARQGFSHGHWLGHGVDNNKVVAKAVHFGEA